MIGSQDSKIDKKRDKLLDMQREKYFFNFFLSFLMLIVEHCFRNEPLFEHRITSTTPSVTHLSVWELLSLETMENTGSKAKLKLLWLSSTVSIL